MGLRKCPRCELNYIKDDEKLCNVCRRATRKDEEPDEQASLCIECGEHPVMKGRDICTVCYKELMRQEQITNQRKTTVSELDLDSVEIKEVAMTIDGGVPEDEMVDISNELGEDFDEDDEDEDTSHDDGEIEFNTEALSVELLGEEEDVADDEDDIDCGITPVRRAHR